MANFHSILHASLSEFKKHNGSFIEKYSKNKAFAQLYCKTLSNGPVVAIRVNLAILAEHQLAVIYPRTDGMTQYQFTVETNNNEHNYDFKNMKLSDIEPLRTSMTEIRKSMDFGSPYYKALEEIYALHTPAEIERNYILFAIKDGKPVLLFRQASGCSCWFDAICSG